jgi:MFS family permease
LTHDAVSRQPSAVSHGGEGVFAWWVESDARARRAFVAAAFGWMLDSFDVMLYSMVLASLIEDPQLHLTLSAAGILNSVTLVSAAAGGITFGVIADRVGRKRALMAAVLIYSVFTAACGFAQSAVQLAVFRILLGLGMGGEWASGAALVSEAFPARHRGKALAFVQSAWAIGYGLAALVNLLVLPVWGWRGVFFVGVIPALFTVWIQQRVEEPELWRTTSVPGGRPPSPAADLRPSPPTSVPTPRPPSPPRGSLTAIFAPPIRAVTIAITAMNACTLFAWWGLNSWVPGYLRLPPEKGGIGLSSSTMSWFVIVMQAGMWLGYVSFGFIADAVGRKRAYVAFIAVAAVLLPIYGFLRAPMALLVLGPAVAFFGTGYYSGFGALTAELYPTTVRATAQGFCYNTGRLASALAPYAVGSLATTRGFGAAFLATGAVFLLALLAWIWIPDTSNRELT